jgi:hypothetical protein
MAYTTRQLTLAELQTAIDWAAAEGWNPGLQDAACFFAADPSGFWGGFLDGELIATLGAVKYGQTFGFIGLYLVKPGYRGQQYGIALWRAGMASLQGRTVGLDGVPAQQANYGRSGFVLAHNNIRLAGQAAGPTVAAADAGVVPLAGVPAGLVWAYDRPFFPEDRRQFLRHWISQPGAHALGILRPGGLASGLAGYGVVRPCLSGYKFGPLLADDAVVAQRLYLALVARVPAGAPVFLDVPALNPAALALAQQQGLQPVFETARMYTGVAPRLPLARLFGITSFELG